MTNRAKPPTRVARAVEGAPPAAKGQRPMPHTTQPSFGIMTAPMQVDYQDILRVWLEADTIPEIEHAWLFDHLMPIWGDPDGPIFEGWTLLSALAGQTRRVVTDVRTNQGSVYTALECLRMLDELYGRP